MISPCIYSIARNRLKAKVDLPEPVAPTRPTCMPGCLACQCCNMFVFEKYLHTSTVKETFFNTCGRSGAYLTLSFLTSILPCWGHSGGGHTPSSDSCSDIVVSGATWVSYLSAEEVVGVTCIGLCVLHWQMSVRGDCTAPSNQKDLSRKG